MSWYSKFNPTPAFPNYTGPYTVGSVDVELPAHELDSPTPAPEESTPTVSFRVFYPCESSSSARPIRWIPNPQRGYISAYARFLGANPTFANIFALFPQLLYYVTIPALRNAKLLSPDRSDKWPVMVFSHGLGGSRNAYSHICGSVASHGVVVIAPDHRDGSAPISYVRDPTTSKTHTVDYRSYPHHPSAEVFAGRDAQLRIRLWEMGLIHDAITKIDKGTAPKNLDSNSLHHRKKDYNDVLSMFRDKLDVQRPGTIAWAGHSFGAATTMQLVKSTYYRPSSSVPGYKPLFTPKEDSSIVKQITPSTPVILLDMWCLPLTSPSTRWLWEKPLPCYEPSGPGGNGVLAILSEGFFKWRDHLVKMKLALSSDPTCEIPSKSVAGPRFFYPIASAHLSQSDFGILFPWMTKKAFKCEDPERTLRLNTRAILQLVRDSGWTVADTSAIDREEQQIQAENGEEATVVEGKGQDWKILDPQGGIKGWISISLDAADQAASDSETETSNLESDIVPEINKRPSQSRRATGGIKA